MINNEFIKYKMRLIKPKRDQLKVEFYSIMEIICIYFQQTLFATLVRQLSWTHYQVSNFTSLSQVLTICFPLSFSIKDFNSVFSSVLVSSISLAVFFKNRLHGNKLSRNIGKSATNPTEIFRFFYVKAYSPVFVCRVSEKSPTDGTT